MGDIGFSLTSTILGAYFAIFMVDVVGLRPEIADEMFKRATAKGYKWADLSITSEDNPDTIQLAERMGAVEYKRWQVYRWKLPR